MHDAETNSVIATYEIQSIILYFRGPVETAENGCFAFTWLHGDALFQCHVFRCHIPEAVNQVSGERKYTITYYKLYYIYYILNSLLQSLLSKGFSYISPKHDMQFDICHRQ